jgi:hypothetical protein
MTIGELKQALAKLPDEEEAMIKAGQLVLPIRGIQPAMLEGMKTVALILPGEPT